MKKIQSVFYHVTTPERWENIKKEGILYGIHGSCVGIFIWAELNKSEYRDTYLSPRPYYCYGTVVLKVKYTPKKEDLGIKHNYNFNPPPGMICSQFSVFEPIPLSNVKRIFWGTIMSYVMGFFDGTVYIYIPSLNIKIGFFEKMESMN